MAHYRKKPVVIEARQLDNSAASASEIVEWAAQYGCPVEVLHDGGESQQLLIPTLEGDHLARPGDFIIKGVKNEFYPCKADIFEQTYELAV